jgi:hypothetical protein
MAYTINRWDGTAVAVIEDGTVNQSLDVKLIGKNYAGYGEIQNENFLHLTENFAGSIYPASAIRGQLWYDTANKKLKVHTGDLVGAVKQWKTIGGADYGITEPAFPNNGDLWFDTTKDQLKVRTGETWLSVGPQSAGAGTTQMLSKQVRGFGIGSTTPENFSIIIATINDEPVYMISRIDFTLDISDADSNIPGFNNAGVSNLVKTGVTLANTNSVTGISGVNSDHLYWGTSSNALRLGGFLASDYVRSGSSSFTATVRFSDAGYTVGDSNDLAVFIDGGTEPIIQNITGPNITFRVRDGADIKSPLSINPTGLIPSVTETFNIGSNIRKWKDIYAENLFGIATQANELRVGTEYRVASTSAGANTIAARDASGNLSANTFNGNATSATRLATIRTINGVNFDGTNNIIVEDATKVRLDGSTMTGFLTLSADPTSPLHAATKNYIDNKFGIGGILQVSFGGTGATTAENARTNLDVPSRSGSGATGTWAINTSGTAGNALLLEGFGQTTAAVINTVARRDGSANLTANVFVGTATSARYADLAEKYLTDNDYEVGTVVMIGGEKEVTACTFGSRAVGAISGNPAYMMNSGLEGGQYVALKGRVPVKVTGSVKKGDRMIASNGGVAIAGQHHTAADTFAIALESNDNTDIKLVECLIL